MFLNIPQCLLSFKGLGEMERPSAELVCDFPKDVSRDQRNICLLGSLALGSVGEVWGLELSWKANIMVSLSRVLVIGSCLCWIYNNLFLDALFLYIYIRACNQKSILGAYRKYLWRIPFPLDLAIDY